MSLRPHRGTSRLGTLAVLAILAVTMWKVWLGPGHMLPVASAQMLPDRAADRQQMLAEMRKTNQLLSELVQILKTETLQVRLEGTDKKVAPPPGDQVR